jgi:hypothetical protein
MRRVETWFKGVLKRETEVFISRRIDHIEIVKTTTLFGHWTVKEETQEVFLPDVKFTDKGKLRVIAEAYLELQQIGKELKEEFE